MSSSTLDSQRATCCGEGLHENSIVAQSVSKNLKNHDGGVNEDGVLAHTAPADGGEKHLCTGEIPSKAVVKPRKPRAPKAVPVAAQGSSADALPQAGTEGANNKNDAPTATDDTVVTNGAAAVVAVAPLPTKPKRAPRKVQPKTLPATASMAPLPQQQQPEHLLRPNEPPQQSTEVLAETACDAAESVEKCLSFPPLDNNTSHMSDAHSLPPQSDQPMSAREMTSACNAHGDGDNRAPRVSLDGRRDRVGNELTPASEEMEVPLTTHMSGDDTCSSTRAAVSSLPAAPPPPPSMAIAVTSPAVEISRLRHLLRNHPQLKTIDLCLKWTIYAQRGVQMLSRLAMVPVTRTLTLLGLSHEMLLYDAENDEFSDGGGL